MDDEIDIEDLDLLPDYTLDALEKRCAGGSSIEQMAIVKLVEEVRRLRADNEQLEKDLKEAKALALDYSEWVP